MLKSENLKLNLFEDSDYVRPDAFNENSQILDSFLKNNLCWATGTFTPYNVSTTDHVTLEFEGKPMMIVVLTIFGVIIAMRDCPHVYNAKKDTGASDDITAEWTDNSVTLRSKESLQLCGSAADPHYMVLLG